MYKYKYGNLADNQIISTKQYMRKKIYFLLLCADPNTKDEYKDINLEQAFNDILNCFGGLNEILLYPPELVVVIGLLEAAHTEYHKENFNFSSYRKLVLDAGNEVLKIKEVS